MRGANDIKVLIFEDHPMTAQGLKAQLEQQEHISVYGIYDDISQLIEAVKIGSIDLLIADVVVPGTEGLTVFQKIKKLYPELRVLAYSALNNVSLQVHLQQLGIQGFVNKRQSFGELLQAVHTVLSGQSHFPGLPQVEQAYESPQALSEREKEILLLVARGLLTKEIALELDISTNTVMAHRTKLFQKLQVQNLGELLQAARHLGYVED